MTGTPPLRTAFHLVSSPVLLVGSLSCAGLLIALVVTGAQHPTLSPWGQVAAFLPLAILAVLTGLDGIQRVEIESDGIQVTSLAGLLLGTLRRSRAPRARCNFRLTWSSVDAVELRLSRFQSPFRRRSPRGWLLAGSPGHMVRIPFRHPQFRSVLTTLRRFVHPYFVHLPSREWEGKIPGRQALARMLRTIVFEPSTPSEFITETARACLFWGNFSRAERLMELAVAKEGGDLRILDDYFLMMKRLGNLEKAKPALERLLANRSSPLDLVEMAEVHHAEGDEKQATECLLQAVEQDQESDLAHFLLGCLYLQREGLQETALAQWRKGLDRARHPQLLAKLGETYRYHRELMDSPVFFESERRRQIRSVWSRRLSLLGMIFLLAGMSVWWIDPSTALPFPGLSGSMLGIGAASALVAAVLRRPGKH